MLGDGDLLKNSKFEKEGARQPRFFDVDLSDPN